MNHLAQAIADMHAYYVGQNDDLEAFFGDLALLILESEDSIDSLPEALEGNLQLNKALDGLDEALDGDDE